MLLVVVMGLNIMVLLINQLGEQKLYLVCGRRGGKKKKEPIIPDPPNPKKKKKTDSDNNDVASDITSDFDDVCQAITGNSPLLPFLSLFFLPLSLSSFQKQPFLFERLCVLLMHKLLFLPQLSLLLLMLSGFVVIDETKAQYLLVAFFFFLNHLSRTEFMFV